MNVDLVTRVIREEGIASALRRAEERISEAANDAVMRVRGTFHAPAETAVLNVSMGGISQRLGGLQSQLVARLEVESRHRDVALFTPAFLQSYGPMRRHRLSLREAIAHTGARAIHLEGTFGVDIEAILDTGLDVIVSVHDYSLVSDDPHLLDAPVSESRCIAARRLMEAAKAVVFPSRFFLESHRQLLSLPLRNAVVIEPGVRPVSIERRKSGRAIAFAGSLKRHKGAHLLPDLIRACESEWHIFGGGAVEPLPRTNLHGYYRAGTLPSLLAALDIGLVVLPSIWPEAYLLTLSEAWQAGVPAVVFDRGAPAERIREHGGGWVVADEREMIELVRQWRAGESETSIPANVVTAPDTANAYLELYRSLRRAEIVSPSTLSTARPPRS